MAVRGQVRFQAFLPVTTTTTTPLTVNGTVGLGLGGTVGTPSSGVQFGTWTTGMLQLQSVLTNTLGGGLTTISATGSDARTASGIGTVQLVTPIRW